MPQQADVVGGILDAADRSKDDDCFWDRATLCAALCVAPHESAHGPSTKSLRDSPRHAGALADGPVTI
jgi:hypothetical protein